ncbi:hypothetical protein F0223_18675 [Vibrio coralliilyticus]|uniref:hypothetical protein n=1 Tax=Vibrio TaxID=662 RepID=UPI0004FFBCB3|nr:MULTISPECIES: hypothetical protein [Vibrio]KFI09869.1 hypothetical protein IX95_21895 [Vibrio sp. B183]NOI20249.1 hypothetical protein [Vibrio coralliilyticus]
MNIKLLTLLTVPMVTLAGVSSDSMFKSLVKDKPKADYVFSAQERAELLAERLPILSSMQLTYEGQTYSKIKYADEYGRDTLVQLESVSGKTVTLMIDDMSDADARCLIYSDKNELDSFDCGPKKIAVSSNKSLVESQTQLGMKTLRLEYHQEALEYLTMIGSTILTPIVTPAEIKIKTSFAFDDFYNDAVCGGHCQQRIESTLGVTTFTQLQTIVDQYQGTPMTMVFDSHIGGSADDDINMYTGLLIKDNNMNTLVTENGSVFSGGTDLFAAGNKRTLERASDVGRIEMAQQIGVHSWFDDDLKKSAKQIPYTDESHRKQATYFTRVMGDKGIDFYLFTLDSAPAQGAHWITKYESDKYDFINEIIDQP